MAHVCLGLANVGPSSTYSLSRKYSVASCVVEMVGAPLLENREMRAPKGFTFEIYMWATRRSARVVGLNSLASYLTEYSEVTILILPAHDR